jgi:hypothetical protein
MTVVDVDFNQVLFVLIVQERVNERSVTFVLLHHVDVPALIQNPTTVHKDDVVALAQVLPFSITKNA